MSDIGVEDVNVVRPFKARDRIHTAGYWSAGDGVDRISDQAGTRSSRRVEEDFQRGIKTVVFVAQQDPARPILVTVRPGVGSYIKCIAVARAPLNRDTGGQIVVDRGLGSDLDVILAEARHRDAAVHLVGAVRLPRHEIDRAAGRILAVQSALGSTQYLDSLQIEELPELGGLRIQHELVHI